MQCSSCGVKLSRKLDIQALLLIVAMCVLCFLVVYSVAAFGLPGSVGKALLGALLVAGAIADVLTMRLVVAGEPGFSDLNGGGGRRVSLLEQDYD
jgi:hypothetical protein